MEAQLLDPARDVRDAVAAGGGVVEPTDKIWFHKTAAAVVEPDRCVGCAACVAACPSGSIGIAEDGKPTLIRMCTGCSRCWDFCPLGGLRSERLARLAANGHGPAPAGEAGPVRAAYYARAAEPVPGAQDGGVVTAVLEAALRRGLIQGALLARRRDAFRGESLLARAPEELREAAGSVYDQALPLSLLARPLPEDGSLAFVGTPCQVTALHALRRFPWPFRRSGVEAVRLTVALFCTRSFDPVRLERMLAERGFDTAQVERVDVRGGVLSVRTHEGRQVAAGPVGEFRAAALRGCDECADFSGALADLSVGNCGSPPGFSTVLVRTQAGEEAWAAACDALEWGPLPDLEPVAREERRNRRRALSHLRREFSPEGGLWVSYGEHLRAYAGSERAPVAPPPHRSHHYQISC